MGSDGERAGVTLRLENLGKRFDDTLAVDDLSIEVADGEFLTLLGPSGCGKTTTLRMIAGFERPTTGRIWLGDRDITKLSPQKRGVGMVFQNYALFPHLNVFENVAFGLKALGTRSRDLPERVAYALGRVDLDGYEKRAVQALSGGQQQRVALARAIAPEPPLLLLDEPLSNLDAALRERTRAELRELLKRLGITAVFVTHDQEEAFALSDRIAVMDRGRLQQLARPEDLYDDPANVFVAAFMGRANFLPARTVEADAGDEVECLLPGGARWTARSHASGGGTDVRLMIRPEALHIVSEPTSDSTAIRGVVVERRFAGATTMFRVQPDDLPELLIAGPPDAAATGDEVGVVPADGAIIIAFPGPEA
ncbi:MAG TPA: ABC transporter ATP-binding protein [Longimicrobiaceae bacterium]|nr:ABC transporter ATP-binding protein [Longimicrobiaceae bacterium]